MKNSLIYLVSIPALKAINCIVFCYQYFRIQKICSRFSIVGLRNKFDYNIYVNSPENIKIGNDNFFGKNVYLNAYTNIDIGNYCAIAADCKLITGNHSFSSLDIPINFQPHVLKPIILKDDVWLGYNVLVMPGVTLGRGCVVAAGSVVTKSFDDYSVIAGVPAKLIYNRCDR